MFKKYYFSFLVLSVFILFSCQKSKERYSIDLDNLYAIKSDAKTKDSLAQSIHTDIQRVLALNNTNENPKLVDSVLRTLRWTGEEQIFLSLSKKAQTDALYEHDYLRLGNINQNIAVYYQDKSKLDSVYYYYLKAEHAYRLASDSLAIVHNGYYQGRLLFEIGIFSEAESKLLKVVSYLRANAPHDPVIIEANQMIAFLSLDQGDDDKALLYLESSLEKLLEDQGVFEILPPDKLYPAIANLYNNIAYVYNEKNEYEKSLVYSSKALEYLKEYYVDLVYAFINTQRQVSSYYLGENPDVIEGLMVSYEIYKTLNHPFYQSEIALFIAQIYKDKNIVDKSNDWNLQGYQIAVNSKLPHRQKQALEQILLFQKQNSSSDLLAEYITLSNELQHSETSTREKFTKIEFETYLLVKENESLKQQIIFIAGSAIFIIFVFSWLLYFIRLKNKNKELVYLNIQKTKNEYILNLMMQKNAIANQSIALERDRIARDLHDSIVSSIFTLRFHLQQIDTADVQLLETLVNQMVKLEGNVRNISHSLSEMANFATDNFEDLLLELTEKQRNSFATKFHTSFKCSSSLQALDINQKMNIYLIVQEAFHNVNKYSKASLCELSIYCQEQNLVIKITDNGIGMAKNYKKGLGIKSMKARAQAIGAKLQLRSETNKGTTLEIVLSLKKEFLD
ncbi:sensor histidine kinase [Myroides sp. LJL116]